MIKVLGEYDNAPHYARKVLEESPDANFSEIELVYSSNYFNQDGFGSFSYESKIIFHLEQTGYKIADKDRKLIYEKLYSEQLTAEETQNIISREKSKHIEFIQHQYERITRKTDY